MNKYRSHNCSEIRLKDENNTVKLSGWIHRKRDHGNLLFIDLRDHYGLTQCVVQSGTDHFKILERIRPESVILCYTNEKNKIVEEKKDGQEARIIQHEIDHLSGKLFVDYLSSLKRNILIKKVTKLKKMGEI